jgi:hypothetical protein
VVRTWLEAVQGGSATDEWMSPTTGRTLPPRTILRDPQHQRTEDFLGAVFDH